jgi:hypothetical protein
MNLKALTLLAPWWEDRLWRKAAKTQKLAIRTTLPLPTHNLRDSSMARLPRYNLAGQPQHVILRDNNRCIIFAAEGDWALIVLWKLSGLSYIALKNWHRRMKIGLDKLELSYY